MDNELNRQPNETIDEYKDRIYSIKPKLLLSWKELAAVINNQTDCAYSDSKYRKEYKKYRQAHTAEDSTPNADEITAEMKDFLLEFKKERVKLSDERIQNNAYVRQLAREETIKEIAHDAVMHMNNIKQLDIVGVADDTTTYDAEGILELSDWHYGIVCDNYWNKYDPDVCLKRVQKLKEIIIDKCIVNGVKKLTVLNLADLICGRIHLPLRLESRFDVITQIMQVSEILCELLNDLSNYVTIDYYDCLDNHSRLEPDKHNAIDLESLARITPWYIKERLKDNHRIKVFENKFDDDIITFNVFNFNCVGVHGDKDKASMVIDRLTLMTKEHFDLVCTAHMHHFSADEKNETLLIANGSLMGTDTYAKNLRLCSRPSQNLIIATKTNVAECIYRMILD